MTESYKKALFIDIDGTLTMDGFRISERTEAAIINAREKGHYLFINTGRALGNIPAELYKIIELFDGISAGSGTHIRIGDRILSDQSVNINTLRSISNEIRKRKDLWAVYEGKHIIIGQNEVPKEWNTVHCISDEKDFSGFYTDEPVEVIAIGKTVPEDIKNTYRKELDIIQMKNFADCIPVGCSKAQSMKTILEHIGIPNENSIAIGDSENDLAMLRAAGHSVAVANAAPSVLESVDEITSKNTEDGVAKIIEKYCL